MAERLWDEYEVDIGPAETTPPAETEDALALVVENRLFRHRTRLGERRFILSVADMYMDAVDGLWPDHLAMLQDVALSIALSAQSHAAALTQFAQESLEARNELRFEVADAVISSLLRSEYVEPSADSEENRIERLPSELSDLIT